MDGLLDLLAATPKAVAQLVAEVLEASLDDTAPGEWSARVVVAHLRDHEYLSARLSLERMLAEERPRLHPFDTGGWAPRRSRQRDRKELLLGDFALQRQASLGILRGLRPGDWERCGSYGGGPALTVADLVTAWADHDRDHLAQLERVLGETLAEVLARRSRAAG